MEYTMEQAQCVLNYINSLGYHWDGSAWMLQVVETACGIAS